MYPPPTKSEASSRRRGAAAVELALVAPLFLLLLAGIMEFGQAFCIKHTLSNAARRGARAAVVQSATSSRVSDIVKQQCVSSLGVQTADVTVTIDIANKPGVDVSSAVTGDEVSVTVGIPFSKAGAGFFSNTFSKTVLHSKCTFERE